MSRRPVEYLADRLLNFDQALTAEDHKIYLPAPDLDIRQSALEMVKQMPGGLDMLCCD